MIWNINCLPHYSRWSIGYMPASIKNDRNDDKLYEKHHEFSHLNDNELKSVCVIEKCASSQCFVSNLFIKNTNNINDEAKKSLATLTDENLDYVIDILNKLIDFKNNPIDDKVLAIYKLTIFEKFTSNLIELNIENLKNNTNDFSSVKIIGDLLDDVFDKILIDLFQRLHDDKIDIIEYFLNVYHENNVNCSLEGILHLKNKLLNRRDELKIMYSDLDNIRGFAEDCISSKIHRLIYHLIKLSESSDLNISLEAAQCLGILGPVDLTTMILHSEEGHAQCLKIYSDWVAETKFETHEEIINKYYKKSMDIIKNMEIKNSNDWENLYDTYASLAIFSDTHYQQISEFMKTPIRVLYTNQNQKTNDIAEFKKIQQEQLMYLQLSIEYYLITLVKCDKHNHLIFRLISLFIKNHENKDLNNLIDQYIDNISTHKFISLLLQLSPHISLESNNFTIKINSLLKRCALEHPHHVLPVLLCLGNRDKDKLYQDPSIAKKSQVPDKCKKSQTRIPLTFKIHKIRSYENSMVSSMTLDVKSNGNYNNIICVDKYIDSFESLGGVNAPKKIICIGSDGLRRYQVVKVDSDIKTDAVMQQAFNVINTLFKNSKNTNLLDDVFDKILIDLFQRLHDDKIDIIEYFLNVYHENNVNCSLEGILHLKNKLLNRRDELKFMYSDLDNIRGFAEDCISSRIHRLLYHLIKLTESSDLNISLEAAQCLEFYNSTCTAEQTMLLSTCQLTKNNHFSHESVKCMLNIVNYLRIQSGNNDQSLLNYLHISKAAQYCSAYFTSVLYAELSSEILKKQIKYIPDDDDYILREGFIKIGDPDSIHGCGSSYLKEQSSRIQHYKHFKEWEKVLITQDVDLSCGQTYSRGMANTLQNLGLDYLSNKFISTVKKDNDNIDDYIYNTAWRLSDWSIFKQNEYNNKNKVNKNK
ncbi:hypothetical protein HCN44_010988 [Aphidius gifuensis]|uniref:Uncharacterized protein n=1 Tax=Aphidius gifuensis TaxID=684658 RepID=A0A834Y390_APHGI|nr:hypothetical protein HCN44_010988 [Aphidius gifuensis]